eukprot:TRINITY_DN22136_c0_g1_i1.p1 TRINITY_DN22136_c0_g1~~TRINITY_DN22136_c0_g1_i1.p1  ORF type:complete len:222 (-),score=66.47 TRINITY_DN22136_c0_g1_i1:74-739(-)
MAPVPTQGFGNAAPRRSEGAFWNDMLSADIVEKICDTANDLSSLGSRILEDFRNDLERIKAAFNCQDPQRATLSAERLAVEHAISEIQSTMPSCCQAPSDLHDAEFVVDDVQPQEHEQSQKQKRDAAPEEREEQRETPQEPVNAATAVAASETVDLLDLSADVDAGDRKAVASQAAAPAPRAAPAAPAPAPAALPDLLDFEAAGERAAEIAHEEALRDIFR